jgi:hypothetical protein
VISGAVQLSSYDIEKALFDNPQKEKKQEVLGRNNHLLSFDTRTA